MASFKVQNSSLLCKNNCGFYGNPSWDGYCSVCYRETYIAQGQAKNVASNLSSASTQAFSKFEAKRKQLAGRGASTLKQIFRFAKDGNRDKSSPLPEESIQAETKFNAFLATLRAPVSADVSRMVSKLLDELDTMAGSHINQYSVVIQNFYQSVSDRISTSSLYAGMPSPVTESLLNAIERFVTTFTYCWTFASPITDDESVDLKLQEKIRSLHWITPSLLDSPINPRSSAEMAPLEAATLALIKVNTLYASEDKLAQIVQCCLRVFDALHVHYQNVQHKAEQTSNTSGNYSLQSPDGQQPTTVVGANADDFLPTLIWVVLMANPPFLHSNLQFIMRFANQNRLNSGQAGYFFTNLSCAVHFLTNLTHESLNMTEQEFYRCMRTGLPIARPQDFICEGERLMANNEIQLLDLEDRTSEVKTNLEKLQRDLNGFDAITQQRIELIQSDYPLTSCSHKLDPRHLETPHVLLLGPMPNTNRDNQCVTTNSSQSAEPCQSLLDAEVDEEISQKLPMPIAPSPYSPNH